ncbi:MAG: class I SAM-dependent methyltransferase [Candidatus Daviesbacteria bacterium]|nr:class I SAM-dependent methyltransferase [Candidatus Daviesbacteria bacterium]
MKSYLYQDLYELEDIHWWHISKRKIVQNMIKTYIKIKNPKILDVGCGTGKNMEGLQKIGKVWGLDQSIDAIKYCKMRGLKNVLVGDAKKTNLSPDNFDVITLLDVLEHTDDNKTLKEMQRILKKDGIIIITVPAFSWLWSRWDEVLFHKRRYTKENLIRTLENTNLHPLKVTYLYSFLVIPSLIIRKIKGMFFKNNYPSDFRLSNPFFNALLNLMASGEFYLAKHFTIPFGTSIIAIAKKE